MRRESAARAFAGTSRGQNRECCPSAEIKNKSVCRSVVAYACKLLRCVFYAAAGISAKGEVNMKKYLRDKRIAVALVLCCFLGMLGGVLAEDDTVSWLRYVPISVEVSQERVLIEGAFVNLSGEKNVVELTNLDLKLYLGGEYLVGGTFDTPVEVYVPTMGVCMHSFEFLGEHDLNAGYYDCTDDFYVVFDATISYRG